MKFITKSASSFYSSFSFKYQKPAICPHCGFGTDAIVKENNYVSCAIRKDSGDDPDVTNGILVYAGVSFVSDDLEQDNREGRAEDETIRHVILEAGEGIGRVTQKGLEQSIGDPAINLCHAG